MKKLAAPMKSFGNLILMTLICIVIFIVFMALRPANAQVGYDPLKKKIAGVLEIIQRCRIAYNGMRLGIA